MGKHKKRSFNLFRATIVVLIIVIIILVLILVLKNGINLDKKEDTNKDTTEEVVEENKNLNETVSISLNSYDVYYDDDDRLGFNFIIANLKFTSSDGSLYYQLGNLTTGEKKRLDDCTWYLEKIQACNYDIKQFNLLNNEFSSDAGYVEGNVFIPFANASGVLSIYNGEKIDFNLNEHKHSVTELFFEVETEDIKTDKYDISVSNSYTENTFVKADTGEEFVCPLALVFELKVNSLETKNVHIEDAKFIPQGALADSKTTILLPSDVNSYKIENIIDKNLKVGDKYGLFFQISEETVTQGKILIKFSDSDKWVEVKTGE